VWSHGTRERAACGGTVVQEPSGTGVKKPWGESPYFVFGRKKERKNKARPMALSGHTWSGCRAAQAHDYKLQGRIRSRWPEQKLEQRSGLEQGRWIRGERGVAATSTGSATKTVGETSTCWFGRQAEKEAEYEVRQPDPVKSCTDVLRGRPNLLKESVI
jgi:hypothetical protein